MKILLIEDNKLAAATLMAELASHEVVLHDSLSDFEIQNLDSDTDLILLDLMSAKDPNGAQTIARIPALRSKAPHAEVWVQSGQEDLNLMRDCIGAGAHRYLFKEHLLDEVPLLLEWVGEQRAQRKKLEKLIVGKSEAVERLRSELLGLSRTEIDVLIEGESGSGKELCARAFERAARPFVAVNIAALPKDLFEGELFGYEKGAFSGATQAKAGFFEAAHGGVLFLDEIQSLSLDLQSKLLRVLETRTFRRLGSTQERRFEARVVCASNQLLRESCARGDFREDLYYRIAPVTVRVPPLRVRFGDVPILAEFLLRKIDPQLRFRFDLSGMKVLEAYDWPGNVRELGGLIKALAAKSRIPVWGSEEVQRELNQEIVVEAVKSKPAEDHYQVDWDAGLDKNVQNFERWMLSKVLSEYSGLEARERLKLKRSRFYEKLKLYSLIKESREEA
jgi:DNA-binding NtrC family response regulator